MSTPFLCFTDRISIRDRFFNAHSMQIGFIMRNIDMPFTPINQYFFFSANNLFSFEISYLKLNLKTFRAPKFHLLYAYCSLPACDTLKYSTAVHPPLINIEPKKYSLHSIKLSSILRQTGLVSNDARTRNLVDVERTVVPVPVGSRRCKS